MTQQQPIQAIETLKEQEARMLQAVSTIVIKTQDELLPLVAS